MTDSRFYVGICPHCAEPVYATRDEIAADWIECKDEDCGFCAKREEFEDESDG